MTVNPNNQLTLRDTELRSAQHRFAYLTLMRCGHCSAEYYSQSCDVHIRKCPYCQNGKPSNTQAEPGQFQAQEAIDAERRRKGRGAFI